ncbi:aminomethyl-transferring glycine dehydrogenase [Flavobacteriaceae bacterium]|jgi:glycine dehydrogenase|nr:aminomethyl-transferring glycine dehydrogenase [Flavobacteriaceae bacterium]MDB4187255.1 aminomethyl-transferring glycine dehydrogenase [Flavobacteriaceae bacterium]MDC0014087.1 aminomethyl-transferring glycine dehydrogenase [Flavobacteriaceae bacterium]
MFANRHLGPNEKERAQMLKTIGVDSIATLIDETIPADIRLANPLDLPEGISEYAYQKKIQLLSNKNKLYDNYIGMGYHPAIVPAVIQRNILENPGWYTAYTPYQAEIAQGRLEALFNYQTVVTDLTGMELANASLLDESTAAAEAMSLLFAVRTREQKKSNANQFFVAENTLPQTLALLRTRATPVGIEIILGNENDFTPSPEYFGAFFQYPGKNGAIIDLPSLVERAKSQEIKTVIAADLLSLTLLEAPGKYGVDVVVGTTQRFGIPLGYGGPHAAYFATKQAYKRNIPGRIIGQTRDMDGKPALRMALQTREQHIKRDRATSNICTAQVLLAVMAGMYAAYHGPEGLKGIAEEIHNKTKRLESILNGLGIQQNNNAFFDTLHVNVEAKKLQSIALENEINLFYPDASSATISLNEATTPEDFEKLVSVFYAYAEKEVPETTVNAERIPTNLKRESPFMTHPVFNSYHSETALMRYIKKLERKDLALNHSMISLGSCTMKLNAASEMLPLSSPQWGSLHPFSPLDQVEGYQEVLNALTHQLNIVTGFAATSLQPNSGAQGEYSGLMVIRAYHLSRGDNHRDVCIIPASAHGTNPASAVMAGMEVVVTKTDERGNIDWDDLQDKVLEHKDRLSALMVTYPSTHGVFEANIKSITALIHEHGGQVYMDGANMNAQVGLTSPAAIGADVCHLNLHKTFAIPHGGGGPGVGPICVAAHLAPFLPTNPIIPTGGEQAIEAISAAPWGSALACLISYGYIEMLGSEGLQQATEIAILNANYIKERIDGAYPVLYVGDHGRSAHELIIDLRPFKEKGIEVVDVAKRLMDYGFHAPTVSFPVAGTMMIEPTESENLAEIDRFCDAMISIAAEIASSDHHDQNSLLKNAPHTLEMATVDEWTFNYSRKKALYPLAFVRENKFWPTVRRVDEAFGDRNLICSCPSVESYSNN